MQRKTKIMTIVKQKGEVVDFDYKNPTSFAKYVSELGRIIPRSRSGLTAKEQKLLANAVKRARMLALMPFAK